MPDFRTPVFRFQILSPVVIRRPFQRELNAAVVPSKPSGHPGRIEYVGSALQMSTPGAPRWTAVSP